MRVRAANSRRFLTIVRAAAGKTKVLFGIRPEQRYVAACLLSAFAGLPGKGELGILLAD